MARLFICGCVAVICGHVARTRYVARTGLSSTSFIQNGARVARNSIVIARMSGFENATVQFEQLTGKEHA
eukprot:6824742-Heterocapsa_arctica.AAC.1